MTSFSDKYAAKMAAMQKSVLGSSIHEALEIKKISNTKLDAIMVELEKINGRPTYEDYNFRAGKVMGILRAVAQNPKNRKECLAITNLTNAHIDLTYQVMGNLPYEKDGIVYPGRQMDIDKTKELLMHSAMCMGVLLEEEDLIDINQERWNAMYQRSLESAAKTAELKNATNIVAYDE